MNCRNCGAPMELFERRRYYFCRHCGSFHFIETTQADGLEVLGVPATALACPACSASMAKAQLDTHPVEYCQQCRGVLVSRGTFVDVIGARRAEAKGPGKTPQPLDERELKRRVICPSCRGAMSVHPYYGPGNVVIDSCERCNVIWLDFGELTQIVDAPGRDRGAPPAPRPSPAGAPMPQAPIGRTDVSDGFDGLDMLAALSHLFFPK